MQMVNESFFLTLVRLGIGKEKLYSVKYFFLNNTPDWDTIQSLANAQGLSAIVLDGLEVLRSNVNQGLNLPDKLFLTQWIGEVLQGYEDRFNLYRRTIVELASFYNSHGYKMMLLKK